MGKTLLDYIGGRVVVEQTEVETVFQLQFVCQSLPLDVSNSDLLPFTHKVNLTPELNSEDETDERPRALIAHSKRYDLNRLREMLNQPFKVITSNSGANALEMVKSKGRPCPFDLIIMEPDRSGLDAAIQIQEFLLPLGHPLIYAYSRTPPPSEQIEAYFTGIL